MSNENPESRRVLTDAERGRNQRAAERRYYARNAEKVRRQKSEYYYRTKAKREAEREAQQNRPTIVIVENAGTEADPLNYEKPSTSRTTGTKNEYPPPVLPQKPAPINIVIVENNTTNPNLEELLQ
jgi:hypothetical protein